MISSGPSELALVEQLERDLARGTSDLPMLPRGVTDALRLARTPGLDFEEVERVAAGDPPLAARVVSVANSALYARAGMPRIASVRRAAVRLGTQATRDVLYQVAYASMFVDAPRFRDLVEATFQHGVRAARCTRWLARERGLDTDVAFLAGLLHDIGRARCWKLFARRVGVVDQTAAAGAVDELHAAAGAELAAAWHLPDEVIDACRWHHHPDGRQFPTLVAVSDTLSRVLEGRESVDQARAQLHGFGASEAQADDLIARAPRELQAPEPG